MHWEYRNRICKVNVKHLQRKIVEIENYITTTGTSTAVCRLRNRSRQLEGVSKKIASGVGNIEKLFNATILRLTRWRSTASCCALSQSPPAFAIRAIALLAHTVWPALCLRSCPSKLVHLCSRSAGPFIAKSKLAVQKSLQELETLKKSLMQKYFGWGTEQGGYVWLGPGRRAEQVAKRRKASAERHRPAHAVVHDEGRLLRAIHLDSSWKHLPI